MRVFQLMLGGLLAVFVALLVGVFVHYVVVHFIQHGRFTGFGDAEGWAYIAAFATFALPALLLAIGFVRAVIVQNELRLRQRLAVGALGGAVACWGIFSFYQPLVFPHGLGLIWPLLLTMGATGGLMIALLGRSPDNSEPTER